MSSKTKKEKENLEINQNIWTIKIIKRMKQRKK